MAEVQKAIVIDITGDGMARVRPYGKTTVSPPLDAESLDIVAGDNVAAVIFEDGTGVVLKKVR